MAWQRSIAAVLLGLAWPLASAAAPRIDERVASMLTQFLRFSPADIDDLDRGAIVKHGLPAKASTEVAVAGAIRIRAARMHFLDAVRDIVAFKKGPGVLQIGAFSDPPSLEDLAGLTVTRDDFDARSCKVNDCPIRLPADVIRRFQRDIDVKAPDAQQRTEQLFKQVLLEHLTAYIAGGDPPFASYDDGSSPLYPAVEFDGILKDAPAAGALVPELPDHLRNPAAHPLPGGEDHLYWSKETFGSAPPFITVTHVVIVCPSAPTCVVATRDVYSSRYLDASLSLTVATDADPAADAMYVVYVNRTRASALKGLFSGLRRAIVERRAKSTLEDSLKRVKNRLEQRP